MNDPLGLTPEQRALSDATHLLEPGVLEARREAMLDRVRAMPADATIRMPSGVILKRDHFLELYG